MGSGRRHSLVVLLRLRLFIAAMPMCLLVDPLAGSRHPHFLIKLMVLSLLLLKMACAFGVVVCTCPCPLFSAWSGLVWSGQAVVLLVLSLTQLTLSIV